jgi:hypothetical protein
MRNVIPAIVALALLGGVGAARASSLGNVRFEVGGNDASLDHGNRLGSGWSVGVSAPVTGWLALGGEGSLQSFGGPQEWVSIPEDALWSFDRTRLATAMVVTTCTVPNRLRISPLVSVATGWSELRRGDTHFYDFNGGRRTIPGTSERGMCAAASAGIVARWARPWPQLQLEGRILQIAGRSSQTLVTPRLTLRY